MSDNRFTLKLIARNNKENQCEEERETEESVEQSKLKKELGEYIGRYNEEKRLREDAEQELVNLKKLYVLESVPLNKLAVGYITNIISTIRKVMGCSAVLSFLSFVIMIDTGWGTIQTFFTMLISGARMGAEESVMYPISALLSGIICLLITLFMPDEGTTYGLINGYRKSQIADRLYEAGLLDEQQEDDDDGRKRKSPIERNKSDVDIGKAIIDYIDDVF